MSVSKSRAEDDAAPPTSSSVPRYSIGVQTERLQASGSAAGDAGNNTLARRTLSTDGADDSNGGRLRLTPPMTPPATEALAARTTSTASGTSVSSSSPAPPAPPAPPAAKTKVNQTILLALFISLFSNSVTLTMLFPFVGFMVRDFHVAETDMDLGYYVGLIASALFLGRAIGSYWWGWMADNWGRKPVILASLLCLAIFTILFGASQTLWWAILTRFITGLLNGLVPACKAVAAEASDDTNQSKYMSIISIAWSSGLVFGPAIGGLLTHPAEKMPFLFSPTSIFATYPALLPCLVSAVLSTVSILLVFLYLPETLEKKKTKKPAPPGNILLQKLKRKKTKSASSRNATKYAILSSNEHDRDSDSDRESSTVVAIQNDASRKSSVSAASAADNGESESESDEGEEVVIFSANQSATQQRGYKPLTSSLGQAPPPRPRRCGCFRNSTLVSLMKDRTVLITVIVYGIYGFAGIVFDEVSSLWFLTSIRLGGIEFDSTQIGLILTIVGCLMLGFSLFLFPLMEARMGALKTFQVCSAATAILVPIFPLTSFLVNSPLLWPALVVVGVAVRVSMSVAFSANSVSINNSVVSSKRGAVNGFAMSVNAATRTLGPSFGGSVFAFSISKNHFPVDSNLIFILTGLLFLVCVWLTAMLPKSLDKKMTEEPVRDDDDDDDDDDNDNDNDDDDDNNNEDDAGQHQVEEVVVVSGR